MTRRILASTLVALALALAAAGACTDDDEPAGPRTTGADRPDSGTLVEGDGYQGVLLDAHLDYLQPVDGPGIQGDAVSSFVPTKAEVAKLEGALPAAFAGAIDPTMIHEVTADDLPSYVRQYTGVASDDLQQLVAHGFCDRAVDDDLGWEDGWIEVNDGGACFWDATLDLATGTIVRFNFNGSA